MKRDMCPRVAIVFSPSWASLPAFYHDTTARTLIGQIAPALRGLGLRVWVVLPGALDGAKLFGRDVITANFRELPGKRFWPCLNSLFLGWQAASFFRRNRIHLAHLFCFYEATDALMVLTARAFCKVRYVISRQTLPTQISPEARTPGALIRRMYSRSSGVVAPSEKAKRDCLESLGGLEEKRVVVVSNGVDFGYFSRRSGPEKGNEKRPYVLAVSRQSPYKGLDLLVWSFFDILRNGADFDLVLCGIDHARGHLSRLVRRLKLTDRVRFVGQVDKAGVKQLVDGSVCFVLASRIESFGMAVLEAMAAGKAVVVSRGAGVSEIMRDGFDGLLVRAGDPIDLTRKLGCLLKEPNLRERLGRNARITAQRHDWPVIARKLSSFYERVLSEQRL